MDLRSKVESRYQVVAKPVGQLYHFMDAHGLVESLKSGSMRSHGSSLPINMKERFRIYRNDRGEDVFHGVSMTRKAKWRPNEVSENKYWGPVRLTFDGTKLSHNYKIMPYNDFWADPNYAKRKRNSKDDFHAQAEEKVLTDKNGLKDFLRYVTKIEILRREADRNDIKEIAKLAKSVPVEVVDDFSAKG